MTNPHYPDGSIRPELTDAIDRAWSGLGKPGTWWTGGERIAIAAETRNAMTCAVCHERKAALSPHHVTGQHATLGELSAAAVDAIHRIRTDAGRLTEAWLQGLLEQGLTEERYVEIVGVVATVAGIDTFDRAMGFAQRVFPEIHPGNPSRYRPANAVKDLCWVSTLAPDALVSEYTKPQPGYGADNCHRALSLVPAEVEAFFDLDVELYLVDRDYADWRAEQAAGRAISEPQIEMIAARAASINGCFY